MIDFKDLRGNEEADNNWRNYFRVAYAKTFHRFDFSNNVCHFMNDLLFNEYNERLIVISASL